MARTFTFSTCKHMLLLVALWLLPLAAQAAVFQYGSLFYETSSDGTAKVVANPNGSKYSGNISIYSVVIYGSTTYVVTGIGSNAFYACTGLTSVAIPESIESIGDYAFAGCTGLTSLTIPISVKTIGRSAFQYCNSMTSLTFNCNPTSIGDYAFSGCNKLTQVTLNNNNFVSRNRTTSTSMKSIFGEQVSNYIIGSNVTAIGSYAFDGCTGMTSVLIPNSVTSIGDYAFYSCTGLPVVTIPSSVTSIGKYAFQYCNSLASLYFECNPTSIGENAFNCSKLTKVTLGNFVENFRSAEKSMKYVFGNQVKQYIISVGVTYIGGNTFSGCTGMTSVSLPYGLSYFSDQAFDGCTGLTSIIIPSSVTSIGNSAFRDCSGLTSIIIPNSVESIFSWAFMGCTGLTSVSIPNSVTSIGNSAFKGCTGLTSITIPSTVKEIENYAFDGCSSLVKVTLNSESVVSVTRGPYVSFKSLFGDQVQNYIIGDEVSHIGQCAFLGCTGMTSVIIPNSVKSISSDAFAGCSGLTSIDIPNIAVIEYGTFAGCSGLTSVSIPNSVTRIGNSAFKDCTGLTSVTIPNSVTSIGESAFAECTGLTSLTIPSSVTAIGSKAFYNCTGLTQVTLNSNAIVSENRNEDTSMSSIFGKQVQTYTIGKNVSSIGEYAFYGCRITSMTIPNNVYNIKKNAFGNCTTLTTVNLRCPNFMQHYFSPDESLKTIFGNQVQTYNLIDVSHIGGCAFYGCTGISSVNCDISLRHIGSMAFEGCTGLTQISFPNDLRYIDEYAFYGCTGLTSVFIPSSVNSLGKEIFYECPNLTKVLLYSKTIVSANRTDSTSLKTIFGDQVEKYRIGDGVSEIGDYAFFGSSNLKSVIIPSSMTLIGNQSFSHCSELERIDCEATTPPDAFNNTFEDVETSQVLLVVPDGSLAQYKAHNVWKQFWVETPTGISSLLTSPEEEPIYDLSGRRLQKMQRGINIVGGKKVLMK